MNIFSVRSTFDAWSASLVSAGNATLSSSSSVLCTDQTPLLKEDSFPSENSDFFNETWTKICSGVAAHQLSLVHEVGNKSTIDDEKESLSPGKLLFFILLKSINEPSLIPFCC